MKTIEERAKEYAPEYAPIPFLAALERKAYIAGATEQKAIDEEVRLKNCDDMTQTEYDRESAFAEWYHKNRNGTPTFSDAIEWARKEVIEKAWSLAYSMYQAGRDNLIPLTKDEFIKAMEE